MFSRLYLFWEQHRQERRCKLRIKNTARDNRAYSFCAGILPEYIAKLRSNGMRVTAVNTGFIIRDPENPQE